MNNFISLKNKINVNEVKSITLPRYLKTYAIVKEVYIEFDNSTEISSQYYKTPIEEIFIEAVNENKDILISRLKDIIDNHISLLILDTVKWIESVTKKPLMNLTYDVKYKDNVYIIEYNTQSYVKGTITLAVRQINIDMG